MNFENIKSLLEKISNENYKDYIKSIISIETNINDEEKLDKIYDQYMDNDNIFLLNEELNKIIK